MPKPKILYECSECHAESAKWSGKCLRCNAWGSLKEKEAEALLPGRKTSFEGSRKKMEQFPSSGKTRNERILSGIDELDRVLGGGLLPDSIVLLTGDPGIGKSTLALQWATSIANKHPDGKIVMVSGEESPAQISDRAFRLGSAPKNLYLLQEFLVEDIIATIETDPPLFLIVDSVQTVASAEIPSLPGSVTQVRVVAEKLMHLAKKAKIPTVLIGHVTKSGDMAGPQTLAHLVDTIIHLEGDRFHQFRLLRSTKNRFGSVFEIGVFEMTETGLREVKNPSEAFLSGRNENAVGSIIFPTIEGTRPFLVELQTLVSPTHFGYPKRTATGLDLTRLNLILAILEKHAGISLSTSDVFANIVGGFQIREPAADLPLALSLASSKLKKPLPPTLAAIGELGLSGELRAVSHLDKRMMEAEKLGFRDLIVPKYQAKKKHPNIRVIDADTIMSAMNVMFNEKSK